MRLDLRSWTILITLTVVLAGCRSGNGYETPRERWMTSLDDAARGPLGGVEPDTPPPVPALRSASGIQPVPGSEVRSRPVEYSGGADHAEFAAVLGELQAIGAMDQQAQARLMEDLRETEPQFWPLLLDQARAALAYRRKQSGQVPVAATGAVDFTVNDLGSPSARPRMTVGRQPAGPPAAPDDSLAVAAHSDGRGAPAAVPHPGGSTSLRPPPAVDTVDEPAAVERLPSATGRSPETKTPVARASYERWPENDDWRASLGQTIQALEHATSAGAPLAADMDMHTKLRLLYLISERRDDALRPIPGISPGQQEFWSNELFGLAELIDSGSSREFTDRATAAKSHLNEAISQLAEQGTLVVRNLAFCTEVSSYGVFTEFKESTFAQGQEVLLYAEVENFEAESTESGQHRTALKSRYQILDSQGRHLDEHDFDVAVEVCRNRRQDFFIRYLIYMPPQLFDEQYTLTLTIEDTIGHKVGQNSIVFQGKPG